MLPNNADNVISSFDVTHTVDEEPTKSQPNMEGTPQDQDDMTRMGKIQELKVLFGSFWYDINALN